MRWFDRLLVVLASLLIIVNVLPLGARLYWMLELTTHFRVQYVVLTVVVLALVALRRRFRLVAALAVAGAVSAAPVLPYLPRTSVTEAAAASGAAPPLKILTVNVSYRQFSARRLLESVREADPDIVILQELTPHTERVLADLDSLYPNYRKFPADGAYGIGLWSRYELESGATIALGRLPAIEARVRGPSGSFTVIGVHLSAPVTQRRAAARNQQLKELATRSAAVAGPLIVAGDFNTTPYSPYFADWLEASGLTDSRRGRTLSVSWPTMLRWVGIPIDHVAVNGGFTILSHRRLPNFESDHFGALVQVALRNGEQR
jgi:endonuclease/exonuclease/phosphatase (EEP) superfamily protein YafD